jgi:hypothetical protein
MADGRVSAWVAAWQCLNSATQLREEITLAGRTGDVTDAQREQQMIIIGEQLEKANIYSALASVPDPSVALAAAEVLERWEREASENVIPGPDNVEELASALKRGPAKKAAPRKRAPARKRATKR